MFPLRLRHDAPGAPVATAYVADATPAAAASGHWCQLASHWCDTVGLPAYMADAPAKPGAASASGAGSVYALWSAQLIGQVDVDTLGEFKAAAAGFRAVPPPATPGDAAAAAAPLYCRHLLVRRSDGGLVSGNAARALVGWAPLPPPPPGAGPESASAARDRELAHDDAQFLVRAPVETHVALAARLADYFVCVRVSSRYFSLRFGAVVIAVGVPPVVGSGGGGGGEGALVPVPAPLPPAPAAAAASAPQLGFLAAEEEDGVTLVTVAVRAADGGGGWAVEEEAPPAAEAALADAGFFTGEGTNAASVQLPLGEVVALLAGWGWVHLQLDDVG